MTEERTLPASAKKLRDARRKGQIAQAPDLVAGSAAAAAIGCLLVTSSSMMSTLQETYELTVRSIGLPFREALAGLAPAMAWAAASMALPPLAAALLAALIVNVAANGGFLVSVEPLVPKLERVSPAAGLKRIFGKRGLVELLKSLIKAAALGGALVLIVLESLDAILRVPACGFGCFAPTLSDLFRSLFVVAIAVYLVAGIADLFLQKWLFAQEMRMTPTEAKRERKDQDGDPHVKGERRRLQREGASQVTKLGVGQGTVIIVGETAAVVLRYVRPETPLPVVVARAQGARLSGLVHAARRQAMPSTYDDELASALAQTCPLGRPIRGPVFQGVARALYASGAVRVEPK